MRLPSGLRSSDLFRVDDNVRDVQTKLGDGGFYSGEHSTAQTAASCSAGLTRYQIRDLLPITGQLDVDTSKALGTKPAVTTTSAYCEQSSETWRRLRKGEQETLAKTNGGERLSPGSAKVRSRRLNAL